MGAGGFRGPFFGFFLANFMFFSGSKGQFSLFFGVFWAKFPAIFPFYGVFLAKFPVFLQVQRPFCFCYFCCKRKRPCKG